jgi:rubrerythrin
MRILISEGQLENLKKSINKGEDIDERSRSFAFTRKKRLFSKPERMSNPLRYKESDRLEEYRPLTDIQIKSIEDLNKDAKFLTCKNCRKKFTQTTHKKKKSLPICPYCGTHNK